MDTEALPFDGVPSRQPSTMLLARALSIVKPPPDVEQVVNSDWTAEVRSVIWPEARALSTISQRFRSKPKKPQVERCVIVAVAVPVGSIVAGTGTHVFVAGSR